MRVRFGCVLQNYTWQEKKGGSVTLLAAHHPPPPYGVSVHYLATSVAPFFPFCSGYTCKFGYILIILSFVFF